MCFKSKSALLAKASIRGRNVHPPKHNLQYTSDVVRSLHIRWVCMHAACTVNCDRGCRSNCARSSRIIASNLFVVFAVRIVRGVSANEITTPTPHCKQQRSMHWQNYGPHSHALHNCSHAARECNVRLELIHISYTLNCSLE